MRRDGLSHGVIDTAATARNQRHAPLEDIVSEDATWE